MDTRSIQSEISSYVGRLLRDNFGKGPASVYVSLVEPYVTIYLKDFLAPMERVLVGKDHTRRVEETRDLLMEELIPDIKATWKATTGIEIKEMYYDWSLSNRSGVFIGILNTQSRMDEHLEDYEHKINIHHEVIQLSKKAEKPPENLESFMLNNRTLIVVRDGILVPIEKALIEAGHSEVLKLTKRNLERNLINQSSFEDILNTSIEDYFVDWDFQKDISYILFILKPKASGK
ncbi:DUF2294 domain-containing protein [Halobacillus salinarum]|uniref:DUF2294 domain-containing protein n=1 Tax=Halobacillus salinarum TaxID=2932257 RepID=A0ABY4EME8_9BACI|nr:Na-translocating system protein MpsC family protein [Halobacillus salinarum]UOQ45334.1 DUF2294 domain-containing protein [Halobacillus salinarum]